MRNFEKIRNKIRNNNKKAPKKHVKRMTSKALRASRKQLEKEVLVANSCEIEDTLYSVVIL